jgi:hypothetical protein
MSARAGENIAVQGNETSFQELDTRLPMLTKRSKHPREKSLFPAHRHQCQVTRRVVGTACGAAVAGLITVTALASGVGPAGAWPGDPDGSFGTCGLKRVDVTAGETGEATSALVDDGRYVLGGSVGTQALVAKFTSSGGLDPAFGAGGKRAFSSGDDADILALTRQADAKIVAVGARTLAGELNTLVVRLTPEGDLDTTFNGPGHGGADPAQRQDRGRRDGRLQWCRPAPQRDRHRRFRLRR